MSEINQAILISSITVITVLLTIIGIQIAIILREVRRSVEKINKIITDAGVVSGTVTKSVHELSGVSAGIKTALSVFRAFKPGHGKEKDDE